MHEDDEDTENEDDEDTENEDDEDTENEDDEDEDMDEDEEDEVKIKKNKQKILACPPTWSSVRKRIEILQKIQIEHDELEAQHLKVRAALESKYQKECQSLYSKRYDIVNGVEVDGIKEEAAMDQEGDESTKENGVPDFWLTAMKNNEVLAMEVLEWDEGALKYLKDIKWCRINVPKGFKIDFLFDINPYFKNTVLTKTYHMVDEDKRILDKAIGTKIEWYHLTHELVEGLENVEPSEGFFSFFDPPKVPKDIDDDTDEDTDEDINEDIFEAICEDIYKDRDEDAVYFHTCSVEELRYQKMGQDYDVGLTIRDKIISQAVRWYTGEAIQRDMENEDDEEEKEKEKEKGRRRKRKMKSKQRRRWNSVYRKRRRRQGRGQGS